MFNKHHVLDFCRRNCCVVTCSSAESLTHYRTEVAQPALSRNLAPSLRRGVFHILLVDHRWPRGRQGPTEKIDFIIVVVTPPSPVPPPPPPCPHPLQCGSHIASDSVGLGPQALPCERRNALSSPCGPVLKYDCMRITCKIAKPCSYEVQK